MDASFCLVALLFTIKKELRLESPSFVSSSTLQLDKDVLTVVLCVKTTAFKEPWAPFIRQYFHLTLNKDVFSHHTVGRGCVGHGLWHVENQHFKDAF